MRQTGRLVVLAAGILWLLGPSPADAQFGYRDHGYGGYGGYGGYADDGAWGLFSSAMTYRTTANAYEASRLAGQQAATAQSAAARSGVRSAQLAQAQYRTQSMQDQRQSNQDWWFQVEQQQAARQPLPSGRPAPVGHVAGFETAPASPTVARDLIKWPPLLCEPEFAEQRTMVEAPYRRQGTPKTDPTLADYQNMVDAVEQMRIIVKRMASEVVAQDYLETEAFLSQLDAEARGRIEAIQAKSDKK